MNLEEIVSEASMMDEESRASLAARMLRSLPCPGDVDDEEVSRRMREAENDPSILISHEEFLSGIDRCGD